MPHTLIALLDRPHEKSFGMVPLLVRDEESGLHIAFGFSDEPRPLRLPGGSTLQEFLAGHGRDVTACGIVLSRPPFCKIGGWIGTAFLDECRRLSVPEPATPAHLTAHTDEKDTRAPGGIFWIAGTAEVYDSLDSWLRTAAIHACQNRCPATAALLRWCLPDRLETHAATWFTAQDPLQQQREAASMLGVWYRWREPTLTAATLAERFETAAKKLLLGQQL